MRSFFLVLATLALSAAVYGIDTTPKNTLERNILSLLTKWRAGDKGPFSFPLPALDEITMPAVSGSYDGFGVKISSYSTSDLKLLGLKNFSMEELDASEANLKASGRVTVPILTINADKYNIRGRALWLLPITGSGNMSILIRNSEVKFSIRLRNNSTSTWVDTLQLNFTVGGIQANLQDGPDAVSTLLNSSGAQILQFYHDDIVKVVRAQMLPVMDGFLLSLTPEALFKTIAPTEAPNVVQV